jgi:hypothetical protein
MWDCDYHYDYYHYYHHHRRRRFDCFYDDAYYYGETRSDETIDGDHASRGTLNETGNGNGNDYSLDDYDDYHDRRVHHPLPYRHDDVDYYSSPRYCVDRRRVRP